MATNKSANILNFLKQKWHLFFLSALCFYSILLQFLWLKLRGVPPVGDGIPCILRGMDLFQQYSKLSFLGFIKNIYGPNDYPPLIDFTYFLYYKLFGLSSETELMVNSMYLIAGIIGVYGIGKFLFDKKAGVLSALIFASFPAVVTYSKSGFKEFHMMCFLALTIYFLLESRSFTNRKFSILFALSLSLMLMTKYEGLSFLIIPVAIELARLISNRNLLQDNIKDCLINFISILIIVILFGLSWYILNARFYFIHLSECIGGVQDMNSIYFSTKDLTFYFNDLFNNHLTQFFTYTFFIICVYNLLRMLNQKTRNTKTKRILLIFLYFIFPFLLFTFLCEKNPSHTISLLIFAGLIIGSGAGSLKNMFVRVTIIVLVSLHAISIPFIMSISDGKAKSLMLRLSPVDYFFYYRNKNYVENLHSGLIRVSWNPILKNVLKLIKKDYYGSSYKNYETGSKKPSVLLLVNNDPVRFHQLEYFNMKEYSPISLVLFLDPGARPTMKELFFKDKYQYILTETPTEWKHAFLEYGYMKKAAEFIDDNMDRFLEHYQLAGEIETPRSSKVIIYKRRNL